MNLNDLPFAHDEPLDTLLGFHRRIERQLATLARLPLRIDSCGVDAQASADAAALVAFFSHALALHHADEEHLLPLLETRMREAPERAQFHELRHRVESEHRELERDWRSLKRSLEAIAEGVHRGLSGDLIQYFRASHVAHISLEEAGLHLYASRHLQRHDHAELGRGMAARRTRRFRFQ